MVKPRLLQREIKRLEHVNADLQEYIDRPSLGFSEESKAGFRKQMLDNIEAITRLREDLTATLRAKGKK